MKKKPLFSPINRIVTGYITAFIFLIISDFATLYSTREQIKQTALVSHTHKVINDLDRLYFQVNDGVNEQRSFILSKDSSFLEPFYKSIISSDSIMLILEKEVGDNKNQQQNLKKLKLLFDQKINFIQKKTVYKNTHNNTYDNFLLDKSHYGNAVMDSIRLMVVGMQDVEKNLLITSAKKVDNKYAALNSIVFISLILALIFVAFGVVTFIKERIARKDADKKAVDFQNELTLRIEELDKAYKELIEIRREEKFAYTGRIARIIAHEVRNPLTNIDLAISQIKEVGINEKKELDFLFDMVSRNSNRINQLITELLNATRFSELSFTKITVNSILDEALEMAKDKIELGKIKVLKNYSLKLSNVIVDAEKLKIAFLNIIINAIEAMLGKDNAVLQLSTKSENNKCIVEISDNGSGMDEKELSKLFETYYTTKPKGNGLGLANTQNIILNHKGSIDVKSKPGEGSRFIITLTVATEI